MWKLTIEDDEGQQTSLSLAVDEYRLGRAEANTIRLTDRNVSRNHALLKKNGQAWLVKDLRSYNGTYVNGVRVADEQAIANGDIVQLGDYRLELIDEALLAHSAQGAPPPSALPPVHLRPNRLVVIVGPQPGAEFPLNVDKMTIGRSEDATISINHSSVSRVHAELCALGNGRFEIIDKGSANGIRVNGVDLRRGILEAGDALELGDVRLRFVGAGKIFRAGVDASSRLGGGFANGSGRASGGISVARLVGIGAVVGAILIGGFVWLMHDSGTAGTGPDVQVPKSSNDDRLLKEANTLLDSGDVEGAHKKVLEIPENSAAQNDDIFKKVEGKWADSMFEKVAKATDVAEKKKILGEISTTPSVDAERRKKANAMISEIIAAEPTAKPVQGPYNGPGSSGGTGEPGGPSPSSTPTTTKSAEPSTSPGPAVGGPPDEAAMRRGLEPKVWSKRASIEEVRLLKAICSHMGDKTCRNRANAILQEMQEKQKGN